jgi:hypothetical protein
MLPLVLKTIVTEIGQRLENAEPFTWVTDTPTDDDLNHIRKQAEESEFDTLKLRETMLKDLNAGRASLVCKSGPYAKVLAIVHPDTTIPWDRFSAIFQAFGQAQSTKPRRPWRIVWFAHPSPRTVPVNHENGEAPRPEHLNGGYTYPCDSSTIVIYRKEEVCRVLIHELLHAACTDDMTRSEEEREVLTESWAELFLIGVQSRGSLQKASKLWRIQAQWVANQEAFLRKNVHGPSDYAWRYTVGRGSVFASMGIELPPPSYTTPLTSLRFTSPQICP